MRMRTPMIPLAVAGLAALTLAQTSAHADPVFWTDWLTGTNTSGFTATGTLTTGSSTVNVTYNNPQGVSFFQNGSGGETDFWTNSVHVRDASRSPYTSSLVSNIPTGTDMIALSHAGNQTLTFSQAIANPVFSYVSLNGNGYAFDQDFDILSFGDGSVRDAGYWGAGTSFKNVVDLGGGNFEYQLLGTGEPHGTIRFTGSFSSVSWRSLSSENWNGFTVGVAGTAAEVFTPEPGSVALFFGAGVAGLSLLKRRRRR